MITILDSSYTTNEDGFNYITFMSSKSIRDPLTTTLTWNMFTKNDEDDYDELLDTYNKLLWEHNKSKKVMKEALKSLED